MESPVSEEKKTSSVELVELSEQTEPLLQKKNVLDPVPVPGDDHKTSEKISSAIEVEDHNEIKEAPLDNSTPPSTTNMSVKLTPDVECVKTSPSSSPQSTIPPLYGGSIPKNRRRPGSTSDNQRVTMTGTVMRGNSVGQPVEVELSTSRYSLPSPSLLHFFPSLFSFFCFVFFFFFPA